ncbi:MULTISPECIES: ribokinase [Spirulina sp. CCY15215]|uniref:ribokinase n=1 Tax=Spirulina sp. CCY15215 TaxID=2767591 RepID=UPI0019516706|nr:ribokinase [Spirulina major]
MTIVALGSINMDLVIKAPRLPNAGETLMGHEFFSAFGGKGANQAVAVAKLGHPVHFIGQVGGDDFGQTLLLALNVAGVNTDGMSINPKMHSGVASIVVSETGENTIACAAGANGTVGEKEVAYLKNLLGLTKVVLLELGIPLSTIMQAAQVTRAAGVQTILDPAPVPNIFPEELYSLVDIITPNELEASQLVGFDVRDRDTAKKAAQVLQEKGVKTVIITLGEQGAWCTGEEECFWHEAIPVDAIDTVAAGDAFNGALAVALATGKPLREAIRWGSVAGSLAVTKLGAQSSLPDRGTFLQALKNS